MTEPSAFNKSGIAVSAAVQENIAELQFGSEFEQIQILSNAQVAIILQMSANSGEIEIDYEMYGVPDRLQVFYEGKALLDTDFVSGSDTVRVPFAGDSARVEVVVTGNTEQSSTEWEYTLRCPR